MHRRRSPCRVVETREGFFEVCFQRLVCNGLLARRGQSRLLLFSRDGNLVRAYHYPDYEKLPLWCDSGRVYLLGFAHVPGIPLDPAIETRFAAEEARTGNVIDFSRGTELAILTREKEYGSSDGIEDDVWSTR